MKELIVRTISGVLYISIVIFSMFTSREWFMGLFFILGSITINEFLRLIHVKSYISYLFLAVLLYFFSYSVFNHNAVYILLVLSCFMNLFLLKNIFISQKNVSDKKSNYNNWSILKKYSVLLFYMINGFVFLTLIPFKDGVFIPAILICFFVLIWTNDTCAYLIGKNFGKRKLLPHISPKKTVEGFLGGLLGSISASLIIFKSTSFFGIEVWITLAFFASILGTFGDLIQSKFKRQAGVKDSGVIMPGHGGMYDRLDSIIYASPFVYGFLELVNYVGYN